MTWPVPLPDIEPEPEPGGWHAPDGPPAVDITGDGARWLTVDGETRQVAPPGTDHHRNRFVHRGLPAADYVLQWPRQVREQPDEAPPKRSAIAGLIEVTDADDVALLMASAFIGRIGLDAALDGERERAEGLQTALELVDSALHQAQEMTTPDTGMDEFWQAGKRWREQHDA